MANITPTRLQIGIGANYGFTYTWTPVTSADTPLAVSFPEASIKSIQVLGTFDSVSVALHGSNDGTNYAALNVPAGTAIGITVAGIKSVLENTVYVKPVISGGGGSQSISIVLFVLAPNPTRGG